MAEPNLNTPMTKLKGIVGNYLGYGYGDDGERAWTARQSRRIDDYLDSALRQFYFPPSPDGGPASYQWSFLRPTAQLLLVETFTEIDLPADFGGLEGRLTVTSDGSGWFPVSVANEGSVRELLSRFPNSTGLPTTAAVAPQKGVQPGRSPRAKLVVFPVADRDYTIGLQYYLIPEALTSGFPWAYGGAMHAETLIESCLAIAEQRADDAKGIHTEKFMERLAASIGMDRRLKAQKLGYNRDNSDGRWTTPGDIRTLQYLNGQTVLFDGQEWN